MTAEDTIVAISTPPGRGGIGVVRLSGGRAIDIAARLVRFGSPRPVQPLQLVTQRATLGTFVDPQSGRPLDEVIVICFRRPQSYTAEDVVEVSCHGSPVVLCHFVKCCLEFGARAAEPGEFTLRAFLNGRIDLTQAEAVRDLIESRTLYQARVAASQLEGAVSARLRPHKKVLTDLVAKLEAGIDFAEDDVSVMDWAEILSRLEGMRRALEQLVAGYEYGRIVRDGLSLAIVGRPNVGKSSLFNRLLNEDRAIVTSVPGTTRDLVAENAQIGGIPLRFVDTAGIRETDDPVEKIGVEKTLQAIAGSDLRLLVLDASAPWSEEDAKLLRRVRPLGALVIACNKSDLPLRVTQTELERALDQEAHTHSRPPLHPSTLGRQALDLPSATAPADRPPDGPTDRSIDGEEQRSAAANPESRAVAVELGPACEVSVVWISALTGEGVAQLKDKILEVAAPARDLGAEGEFITHLRHQQLLEDSLSALGRARQAAKERVHHEMLLLDLYDALRALDTLTGATTVEDVLGVIFSTFCVGK